eukprot:TRINITY_DN9463_c0_g1_i2.p1 TRINITY_DN9463_c0_g1~~TRINITY_DN9463_c0_g1_i2.p1  ORF type:complete len:980 (-),score=198.47 TRINITY_DN9463_c0_g1_i2:148-3087(-)
MEAAGNTVLQQFIDALGGDLDDKARRALTEGSRVTALSVLHRLSNRGEDVRVPSAFVMTALKKTTMQQQTGPRSAKADVDCAIKELLHAGLIDEAAAGHFANAGPREVENLETLLGKPAAASKGGASGSGSAGGGTILDMVCRNLGRDLTPEVMASLRQLHPVSVVSILHKLANRGGEVRSPCGFVSKAVAKPYDKRGRPGPRELECAVKEMLHEGLLDTSTADRLISGGGMREEDQLTEILLRPPRETAPTPPLPPRLGSGGGGGGGSGSRKEESAPPRMQSSFVSAIGGGESGGQKAAPASRKDAAAVLPSHILKMLDTSLAAVARLRSEPELENQVFTERAVIAAVLAAWSDRGAGSGGSGGGCGSASPAASEGEQQKWVSRAAASAPPPPPPGGSEKRESSTAKQNSTGTGLPPPPPPPPRRSTTVNGNEEDAQSMQEDDVSDDDLACYDNDELGDDGEDLREFFAPFLTDDAQQALEGAGPRGDVVLRKLREKGSEVKNPSGYIIRTLSNNMRGSGRKKRGGRAQQSSSGGDRKASDSRSDIDFEQFSKMLDDEATDALEKVDRAEAESILQKLEKSLEHIKNPSAYVCKAVGALLVRQKDGRRSDAPWPDDLDERARAGLEQVNPEVADSILQSLEAKGSTIRNPSAYVVQAVNNELRNSGSAASVSADGRKSFSAFGGDDDDHSELVVPKEEEEEEVVPRRSERRHAPPAIGERLRAAPVETTESSLNDLARGALQKVSPEAADIIVERLEARGGSVRNPSGYVIQAVNNELRALDREQHPEDHGGSINGSHSDEGGEGHGEVPQGERARLILKSVASRSDVKNPSAYVLKAVNNHCQERNHARTPGRIPDPPRADSRRRSGDEDRRQSRREEAADEEPRGRRRPRSPSRGSNADIDADIPASIRDVISDRAMDLLSRLEPAARANLVGQLSKKAGVISNPTAYVIKGCENAKRGLNGLQGLAAPPSKWQRR